MPKNLGATTLKCRRRAINPMAEYDRLPPDLRRWVAEGALPWRARSVVRVFERALAATGDRALALQELDRIQSNLMARDAARIWGSDHPDASGARP